MAHEAQIFIYVQKIILLSHAFIVCMRRYSYLHDQKLAIHFYLSHKTMGKIIMQTNETLDRGTKTSNKYKNVLNNGPQEPFSITDERTPGTFPNPK